MSASKTRRTKQQAHRRKAYAMDQVLNVIHKGHNLPFAHRPCRKSPKEMRKNVAGMVDKWQNTHDNMKGLSHKVDQYLQQGPDLERLKGIVECEDLGSVRHEVIQNIPTPNGFPEMMSTPFVEKKGGHVSANGRTTLFRNLAHSKPTSFNKAWASGTCY